MGDVPFLAAEDAELRGDVLGLPLYDAAGRQLRYVSPAEIEHIENDEAFGQRLANSNNRPRRTTGFPRDRHLQERRAPV